MPFYRCSYTFGGDFRRLRYYIIEILYHAMCNA